MLLRGDNETVGKEKKERERVREKLCKDRD